MSARSSLSKESIVCITRLSVGLATQTKRALCLIPDMLNTFVSVALQDASMMRGESLRRLIFSLASGQRAYSIQR